MHHWAKQCKAGELGRVDLYNKEWIIYESNWWVSHEKIWWNNLRQLVDQSKENYCQVWHFIEMCGLHYWSFSILEGLCRMVPHIPMARMKGSRVEIFSTNLTLWEWSSGISSQYCDSWQNMGSSLWPRNKVSVHEITLQGGKSKLKLQGEKKGYSFGGWCYSHGFPWNWSQYHLRVLHCNTQNFETIIKQSSEAQGKKCYNMTTPDIARGNCKVKFHCFTLLTIQSRSGILWFPPFFQKWKKYLNGYQFDFIEEIEWTTRTWLKKKSVFIVMDLRNLCIICRNA